jgi:CheY-like chemotaxis protein
MAVSIQNRPLEVLIVEDCHDTAKSLAYLVQRWGHLPVIAHNGPDALTLALASSPDVVLLDIGMPGMDGWEVARRLRTSGQSNHPLLVVMSGYCREEDQEVSRLAGCHLHLAKPVNPDVLEYILRQRQRGDEA